MHLSLYTCNVHKKCQEYISQHIFVYIDVQVHVFGDYQINLSVTIVDCIDFVESAVKKINVPGHTVASLTIWDIPGREDMDLHKTYFRDLDAAIGMVITCLSYYFLIVFKQI